MKDRRRTGGGPGEGPGGRRTAGGPDEGPEEDWVKEPDGGISKTRGRQSCDTTTDMVKLRHVRTEEATQ